MTKNEAMKRINDRLGKPVLTDKNTHYAEVVVYGSDEGWWLKIPFAGFRGELHCILNNNKTKSFQHLKIGANQILSPGMKFRRSSEGTADAFMSAANPKRLVDLLDGGSKYNFTKHMVSEYREQSK
ncbi:hypothetical protein [Rugamonas rubra]|jgi:hypothetical protein|uniref:Uncharacterized protein n=1 Tax=Rugamonas rubra TaxID=758825 RepID=A0A1I4TV88_9BURK|nr:hypothetical protein [Rugamonas rubra]SFM80726.1 hypothetical protein SAMN02982985_05371 [Rugamonas rubra]